jgi:hypothetical protein
MSELKEKPSPEEAQSVHAKIPGKDQTEGGIGDTDRSSSSYHDTQRTVEPDAQWGISAPDGGLNAWSAILGLWCTCFCSFGWLSSAYAHSSSYGAFLTWLGVGVFQEYYENSLLRGHSASTISWIPSLQFFLMMGMVRSFSPFRI